MAESRAAKLGRWAVIDIETTGIDPNYDDIIDVGFLEFEGTQMVRSYESLAQSDRPLSQFIQKLTGISPQQVRQAPSWREVENEVQSLHGLTLIAHNADFEKSFLEESFRRIDDGGKRESYVDTLYLLGLVAPWFSSLKLENFITEWEIAEGERHRGLADSEDLLKVMLLGAWHLSDHPLRRATLESLLSQYKLDQTWMANFLMLEKSELEEIAGQLPGWDFQELVEKTRHQFDRSPEAMMQQQGEGSFSEHFSREFSGENIQKIYRNEKAMTERFEGYQYRPSQETLSLRTGQALKNGVHALVQAPTGTGKTIGYLLPAALYAMESGAQVLVATGTKTLQHQAMNKDVPQLYRLLDSDSSELPIASLYGSQNHLCEMLFRQSQDSPEGELFSQAQGVVQEQDSEFFAEKFSDLYLDWVFFHNSHFPDIPVLRADLPYIYKQKFEYFKKREGEIAVDFRSCTGNKCPFKGECTYLQGLRKAKDAKIIVGNHALMFQWPRSFPRPENIIIDEAHKIEGEATKAYSYEVTSQDFKNLQKNLVHLQGLGSLFYLLAQSESQKGESTDVINKLRQKAEQTQQMLGDHIPPLEAQVESYFKKRPRYTDLYWNEAPMVSQQGRSGDTLSQAIYNHLDSVRHIVYDLLESLIGYLSRWEVKDLQSDQMVLAYGRFETFVSSLDDVYRAVLMSLESPDSHACSICYHEKHGLSLRCAPIDVGKVLHSGILENSHAVLFTSATLGNADGDRGVKGIEWATGYTYLDSERRFKSGFFLPAVYDYENKTRVYLCDDTPSLHSQEFVPKVLSEVVELVRELGGRSLLLFSARTRFEVAREYLIEKFEGEIPLFIQGMGNRIVEDFKNSARGILLGMESFGEGIDIPGETLQFVFIDKIPDLRMDYIIQKRRDFYDSQLGNEFVDYYLAHRSRSLHQKLGRLLRTESDVGGVIVVDSRVRKWKGRTMEKFLHLMRPYQVERTGLKEACAGVRDFITANHLNNDEGSVREEINRGHSDISPQSSSPQNL